MTKQYRWHPCVERHTTWLDLACCIWPRGSVAGDGPFAATSCGARDIVLYPTVEQARARKRSLDRDGCRPRCHRHHEVILIEGALHNGKPPATPAPAAITPAAPRPSTGRKESGRSMGARCGRPRTDGQPCGRPAGWGADAGEEWCRDHGGSTAARKAEEERLVAQALVFAELVEKARTGPLTAEEEQQAQSAAQVVLGARERRRGASAARLPVSAGGALGSLAVEVHGFDARSLRLFLALRPAQPHPGGGV
ncbi:hypothetical protein ACIQVK_21415 [Streptomyces sp. NPDC090493]|uniref:hypothetical protein n=1 Tax=Streptomyces sp. NPDC090493 TaxID=3365964 RepID=UPI0038046B89